MAHFWSLGSKLDWCNLGRIDQCNYLHSKLTYFACFISGIFAIPLWLYLCIEIFGTLGKMPKNVYRTSPTIFIYINTLIKKFLDENLMWFFFKYLKEIFQKSKNISSNTVLRQNIVVHTHICSNAWKWLEIIFELLYQFQIL